MYLGVINAIGIIQIREGKDLPEKRNRGLADRLGITDIREYDISALLFKLVRNIRPIGERKESRCEQGLIG